MESIFRVIPENWTEYRAERLYQMFAGDETAQDVVEYALLVTLVATGVIVAWEYILSSSNATVLLSIVKRFDTIFNNIMW